MILVLLQVFYMSTCGLLNLSLTHLLPPMVSYIGYQPKAHWTGLALTVCCLKSCVALEEFANLQCLWIIRPSLSEWASPLHMVPKANSEW